MEVVMELEVEEVLRIPMVRERWQVLEVLVQMVPRKLLLLFKLEVYLQSCELTERIRQTLQKQSSFEFWF
jgi:hypothetical protein